MASSQSVLGGLAVVGFLVLLLTAPMGWASSVPGTSPASRTDVVGPAVSSGGLQASVTWNGENVVSAATMSAAISTNFGSTIDLHYTWSSVGILGTNLGGLYNISDARLEMFYFGFALATRDVLDSNPVAATSGSFDMTWNPGVLQWLLAGTFGITASLLAPNGTVEWSQPFFIHVTAPASVGAIIPILLILIGIYEIYALAASGRQAALSAPARSAGASTPPTGSAPSAAPAATDATGSPAAGGTPPASTDAVPPKGDA